MTPASLKFIHEIWVSFFFVSADGEFCMNVADVHGYCKWKSGLCATIHWDSTHHVQICSARATTLNHYWLLWVPWIGSDRYDSFFDSKLWIIGVSSRVCELLHWRPVHSIVVERWWCQLLCITNPAPRGLCAKYRRCGGLQRSISTSTNKRSGVVCIPPDQRLRCEDLVTQNKTHPRMLPSCEAREWTRGIFWNGISSGLELRWWCAESRMFSVPVLWLRLYSLNEWCAI